MGEAQKPLPGFGVRGRSFVLRTGKLGSVQRGTPICYLGQRVGEVEDDRLVQGESFVVTAFVDAAYAGLVHDDTRFWKAGPVLLRTGATGPTLNFRSLPALVQGAITFKTPDNEVSTPPSSGGHPFTLYDDRQAALFAPSAKSVRKQTGRSSIRRVGELPQIPSPSDGKRLPHSQRRSCR